MGCSRIEIHNNLFYASGVGSAFGGQVETWLKDLIVRPERWMTEDEFLSQNAGAVATAPRTTL